LLKRAITVKKDIVQQDPLCKTSEALLIPWPPIGHAVEVMSTIPLNMVKQSIGLVAEQK
jgi:3-dehydroquinate synthetase